MTQDTEHFYAVQSFLEDDELCKIWNIIEIAMEREGYDVQSWIFLPQHGNGYSVVDADSLETIWKQWSPWRELLEFTIEPCADLDQTVALYC